MRLLIKAHVKQHMRATKTGKVGVVHDFERKDQPKQMSLFGEDTSQAVRTIQDDPKVSELQKRIDESPEFQEAVRDSKDMFIDNSGNYKMKDRSRPGRGMPYKHNSALKRTFGDRFFEESLKWQLKNPGVKVSHYVDGLKKEAIEKLTNKNEDDLIAQNKIRPLSHGIGKGRFWEYRDKNGTFTVAPSKEEAIKRASEEKPASNSAKEPWMMTKKETVDDYMDKNFDKKPDGWHVIRSDGSVYEKPMSEKEEMSHRNEFAEGHKVEIEQALAAGKPVPAEVLAEYPDLNPKAEPKSPVSEAVKTIEAEPKPIDTNDEVLKSAAKYETFEDWGRSIMEGKRPADEVKIGEFIRFTPPTDHGGNYMGREPWYGKDRPKQYNDSEVFGRVIKINPKSITIRNEDKGAWNEGHEYKIPKNANASIDMTPFKGKTKEENTKTWEQGRKKYPDLLIKKEPVKKVVEKDDDENDIPF